MNRQENEQEEPQPVVEIASAVTPELLAAAQRLVPELHSDNQVEITEEYLTRIINSTESQLLIARGSENDIKGMAVLVVYPTLVNPRALLETLVVDPSARQEGFATAIIARAVKEADAKGVNTVRAFAGNDNASSIRTLQKSGFTYETELGGYERVLSVGPRK